jgi:hypothetical protein
MWGWYIRVKKKKKVKVTLVQALRLCTGRTVHRASRVVALPFLDHGIRRGWGVSVILQPLFTPRKNPAPIVQEAGWAPGPVWTGAENLAPSRIRSPDRPAHSESLYRLSYPSPLYLSRSWKKLRIGLKCFDWLIDWLDNWRGEWLLNPALQPYVWSVIHLSSNIQAVLKFEWSASILTIWAFWCCSNLLRLWKCLTEAVCIQCHIVLK